MPTKAELEDENKKLKAAIREFKKLAEKEKAKEEGNLTHTGMGVFRNENKEFKFVEIAYNPVSKESKIIKEVDASQTGNNKDFNLAQQFAKIYLIEKIMSKTLE